MSEKRDAPGPEDAAFAALSQRLIDGELDAADAERISAIVSQRADLARELARLALLHDALDGEATVGHAARRELASHRRAFRVRHAAMVAASLLAVATLIAAFLVPSRDASAAEVLAQVVERLRSGDRTYLVRAIPDPRRARRDAEDLEATRSPVHRADIDGAMLFLRPPSSFVLVRTATGGGEAITGSDGRVAWFVLADGEVRVSGDPSRFAGTLPGGRVGVPFVDPHALLAGTEASRMTESYTLVLEDRDRRSDRGTARIVATRRDEARGGPKRIEIVFDPETSLVESIRLENLPQAHGGPRTVEFLLVDDSPLPSDFFSHEAHHPFDRTPIEEP